MKEIILISQNELNNRKELKDLIKVAKDNNKVILDKLSVADAILYGLSLDFKREGHASINKEELETLVGIINDCTKAAHSAFHLEFKMIEFLKELNKEPSVLYSEYKK